MIKFIFLKNFSSPIFKDREFIEIEHHLMSINVNTQLVQLKILKPEEQLNNSKLVNLLNCLCHRRELIEKNSKSIPNLVIANIFA